MITRRTGLLSLLLQTSLRWAQGDWEEAGLKLLLHSTLLQLPLQSLHLPPPPLLSHLNLGTNNFSCLDRQKAEETPVCCRGFLWLAGGLDPLLDSCSSQVREDSNGGPRQSWHCPDDHGEQVWCKPVAAVEDKWQMCSTGSEGDKITDSPSKTTSTMTTTDSNYYIYSRWVDLALISKRSIIDLASHVRWKHLSSQPMFSKTEQLEKYINQVSYKLLLCLKWRSPPRIWELCILATHIYFPFWSVALLIDLEDLEIFETRPTQRWLDSALAYATGCG